MKVLLIDDHTLFREGLALLLRPLLAGVATSMAGSCEEAFALLERDGAADLALIDLGLPGGMPGLQGIGCLRERWPGMTVVALSSADDRDTVLAAIGAGAMGFIPKSSTPQVLQAALNLILVRGTYLPPSVIPEPARPADVAAAPAPINAPVATPRCTPADLGLTPRQAELLYLLLQGMTTAKHLERAMRLSPGTVKTHTSAVLRALKVTDRTQAVIAAGRLGLYFPKAETEAAAPAGR